MTSSVRSIELNILSLELRRASFLRHLLLLFYNKILIHTFTCTTTIVLSPSRASADNLITVVSVFKARLSAQKFILKYFKCLCREMRHSNNACGDDVSKIVKNKNQHLTCKQMKLYILQTDKVLVGAKRLVKLNSLAG